MSMVHWVSMPNKHRVNRLYVHRKYGMETKEPTTLAATVDEFVHRHQWMDRHGGQESLGYWDEEGVCKSTGRWWG
jgi:hypothetical protein